MNKIGIFGGNFDPFHYGHLNSVLTVADQLGLDQMRVIPASISPLRIQTQSSTPEQRLEMLKRGVEGHENLIQIDTREIKRGGVSYTVDTVESIRKENPEAELTLVIGMDQFFKFDQWKSFDKLLSLVDLAVTTRPGMELPYSLEEWPLGLRNLVGDADSKQAMLKTGKNHSLCPIGRRRGLGYRDPPKNSHQPGRADTGRAPGDRIHPREQAL
jgi:nicotinate-nucleotide adenylyltransferase